MTALHRDLLVIARRLPGVRDRGEGFPYDIKLIMAFNGPRLFLGVGRTTIAIQQLKLQLVYLFRLP